MTSATLDVVVRAAVPVADDVLQVCFERPDGAPLPPFTPGAHIDLHLAPGLVRQYSLCGEVEDERAYTIAVKREAQSRGGSRAVHERLRVGTALAISAPILLRSWPCRNSLATDMPLVASSRLSWASSRSPAAVSL